MPAIDVPGTYQIGLSYEQGGLSMTNVFNVRKDGSQTLEELAQTLAELFSTHIGDQISNQVNWTTVTCRENVPNSFTYEGLWDSYDSGTGQNTSPPEPPGVAFIITWQSIVGGRRGRGRSYIGGCGSDLTSDPTARWSDTAVSNMTSDAESFRAGLNSNDMPLIVLSRAGDSGAVVASAIAKAQFGSQRRRNYN